MFENLTQYIVVLYCYLTRDKNCFNIEHIKIKAVKTQGFTA